MYKDFGNMLEGLSAKFGENPAFVIKEKRAGKTVYFDISYNKLKTDVRAFAAALSKEGLKGKRVAFIGKNSYEWMLTMFSVIYCGADAVPLDKGLSEAEILDQTDRISADAFVFGKDYMSVAEKRPDRINICFEKAEGYKDVHSMKDEGYDLGLLESNCVPAEDVSFYLFTSGTTSKSKIVMLSQKNILSNIKDMFQVEKFYETDVNLALLPMHHTFGLTGTLVFLTAGAKNVFCEGLRVQKALTEYKVSVLVGVPLILDNMKRLTERTIKKDGLTFAFSLLGLLNKITLALGLDMRRKIYKPLLEKFGGDLRLIISGAAPLAPETADFFNSKGIEIIQGYGLTETAPVLAAESPEMRKKGSVGKAMPSVDIKIIDVGEDGTGEIIAKGPNIMIGYYENPELTAEALKDGYFHTGDVGYIDDEGYLFITGRIKNVIVLENGKKVYPEEVEFQIGKLDYVKEVMVYNNKEGKKDKVTAVVVTDSEIMPLDEAKAAFEKDILKINKNLASYKQVKDFVVTEEEFDKTTTGKIKRY